MDDGLKQRLVGATVLVALSVLFVPVLFDREVRMEMDTTTQIPVGLYIETPTYNEPTRTEDIEPAPEPETMFVPQEEKRESLEPSKPTLSPTGVPEAWVIQVASFKAADRAKALSDQLSDDGYKAYTRQVDTSKGPVTRVYVGPKVDKESAIATKDEIDRALKVDSMLLRFQP